MRVIAEWYNQDGSKRPSTPQFLRVILGVFTVAVADAIELVDERRRCSRSIVVIEVQSVPGTTGFRRITKTRHLARAGSLILRAVGEGVGAVASVHA